MQRESVEPRRLRVPHPCKQRGQDHLGGERLARPFEEGELILDQK
jgi:hypothetical protein